MKNLKGSIIYMKSLLIASLFLFTGVNVMAQGLKMREVFTQMPDSILPYLSHNNKLDLIDFIDSGMTAEITNEFDDKTRLEMLTDNYLHLKSSSASHIEMKLLPYENAVDSVDSVVCVLTSFGEEQPVESVIRFYTTKWNVVDIESPMNLNVSELIVCPDTMSQERFDFLRRMISPLIFTGSLSPTENSMEIKISLPILSTEDKRSVAPLLRSKNLKWDGTRFK